MPPTTRLFALLDVSKVSDEAREFFRTSLEFKAILIRTWGKHPPWMLIGITPHGGSVGHVSFSTFAEAKKAAERYFGAAMGEWQEPPRDRDDPGEYVARTFFPGYIDWRVGTGPVEKERLYRAKLRFAEYTGQNEHEHCVFCFKEFYVQTDESRQHGEHKSLQYGFSSEDGNTWVCEPCYYAVRDILDFTAEVT